VHFHDIYFPYDYARDTLDGDMLFPQESGLLYAFLAGNPRFRIEASLSMIHYARPDELKRLDTEVRAERQRRRSCAPRGGRHFPSAVLVAGDMTGREGWWGPAPTGRCAPGGRSIATLARTTNSVCGASRSNLPARWHYRRTCAPSRSFIAPATRTPSR
jgi:hypothetical protein